MRIKKFKEEEKKVDEMDDLNDLVGFSEQRVEQE